MQDYRVQLTARTGYCAANIQINKPRGAMSGRLHTEHTYMNTHRAVHYYNHDFHQTSNTYLTTGSSTQPSDFTDIGSNTQQKHKAGFISTLSLH